MARLKGSAAAGRTRRDRSAASADNEGAEEPDDGRPKRRRASRNYALLAANGLESAEEHHEKEETPVEEVAPTPSGRKRGRPRKDAANPDSEAVTPTARRRKTAAETPVTNGSSATPSRRNLADRSARRKSARALVHRVAAGQTSDDEAGDEDLEQEIFESSASSDGDDAPPADGSDAEAAETEAAAAAATPSKRPRGRPRGSGAGRRARSPTPPADLPPHELYLYQNKPGAAGRTSGSTLAHLALLTHDEYFDALRARPDPHDADVTFLYGLHARSFAQWAFELAQGFSVCLYGYGSKRALLLGFAAHLAARVGDADAHRIVVVNGYVRAAAAPRDVLSTIAAAVDPAARLPAAGLAAAGRYLAGLLSAGATTLTVVLHSIDGPALRRPGVQAVLAQLAAHPRLRLICSADAPDAALLWDAAARASFNFAFHDCTTFAPPAAAELDVVDDVHELLGRTARRVGGRDGVAFVLRSLPENAKSLFRLLVGEVLVALDEGGGGAGDGPGVEYRMLYNKAVEEFICSSEMAFRTLLKEWVSLPRRVDPANAAPRFHDHQMITSRKDALGTELLSLPFRKEELEAILEDLVA